MLLVRSIHKKRSAPNFHQHRLSIPNVFLLLFLTLTNVWFDYKTIFIYMSTVFIYIFIHLQKKEGDNLSPNSLLCQHIIIECNVE